MIAILPIIFPFAGAILALALSGKEGAQRALVCLGSLLSLLASFYLLMKVDQEGTIVLHAGAWGAPYGITLMADRLSTIMLTVSALVAFCASVYAYVDIGPELIERRFAPLYLFLLMGVQGAYLTGDLFNLYVWFEILLCSSFVLMVLGSSRLQFQGSLKYVVLNLLASTLFLIGAGLLYGKVGTLNMADIAFKLSSSEYSDLVSTSGVLLLVAFGIKAGVFPLFFWLPASYHTPPVTISALFAGLLTKVGIYAILRSSTLFLSSGYGELQTLLIGVAIATMVVGVLGAVAQGSILKIISFHIISQVGYILAGVAVMTVMGLASAIFYLVHHIVVKSNLFLLAGIVRRRRGTDQLSENGGLVTSHPVISVLFFMSAFSLAGLPPLSGFWAKLGVLQASMMDEHWLLAATIVLVGILTLLSMLKIWLGAFWGEEPTPADEQDPLKRSIPWALWLPCACLSLCTLGIGVFGTPIYAFAERAALDLLNPNKTIELILERTP